MLFQKPKPLNPVLVGQILVMCHFGILGEIGVKVQHVPNTTETLVECVSPQDVCSVRSREIALADYGCAKGGGGGGGDGGGGGGGGRKLWLHGKDCPFAHSISYS